MALETSPIKGEPFLDASGSTWFPVLDDWLLQVMRSRNNAGDSHDVDNVSNMAKMRCRYSFNGFLTSSDLLSVFVTFIAISGY
jgi:hypothetical protein